MFNKFYPDYIFLFIHNWIVQEIPNFRGQVLEGLLRIAGESKENPVGPPLPPPIQTNPRNSGNFPQTDGLRGNPAPFTGTEQEGNPGLNNSDNVDYE